MQRKAQTALVALSVVTGWAGGGVARAQERETQTRAIVYGVDDRREVYQMRDLQLRAIAEQSLVALVPKAAVQKDGARRWLVGPSLRERVDACADEPFAEQPSVAMCSGVLVSADVVLTAGHCLDELPCGAMAVVQGFHYVGPDQVRPLSGDDVHECDEVLSKEVDSPGAGGRLDYAFFRLRGSVRRRMAVLPDREPGEQLLDQTVTALGFPTGIPAKQSQGRVYDLHAPARDFFVSSLDVSGGNSGSPVFDAQLGLVGVLGRGQSDYVRSDAGCRVTTRESDQATRAAEEATYASRAFAGLCAEASAPAELCAGPEVHGVVSCSAAPGDRRPGGLGLLVLLASVLGLACYRPALVDCMTSCEASGSCPRGHTCSNGRCAAAGVSCPLPIVPDRPEVHDDLAQATPDGPDASGVEAGPPEVAPDQAVASGADASPDGERVDAAGLTAVGGGLPAALPRGDGLLDLFWLNPAAQLVFSRARYDDLVDSVSDLGAPPGLRLLEHPTAVAWEQGRFDVFVRADDGTLRQRWFTAGRWQPWANIEGAIASAPAACSWAKDRLDVFARGPVGDLQHRWYDEGWMSWESLGGEITSAPAVASPGELRIEVFARGPDGDVLQLSFASGWYPWHALSGSGAIVGAPAATSRRAGSVDVYALDREGRILHRELRDHQPSAWERTEVISPGGLQVVGTTTTRVDVLSRHPDGRLWHHAFNYPDH